MKRMKKSFKLLFLATAALVNVYAVPETEAKVNLWAAISVHEPLIISGSLKQFHVTFALTNDSTAALDPKVGSWRLVVNGKEHPDSQSIFLNGPRDARWESLPPGDNLQFTYALGDWFKESGTHTIIWKGNGFQSAPVMFRVLKCSSKNNNSC